MKCMVVTVNQVSKLVEIFIRYSDPGNVKFKFKCVNVGGDASDAV